MTVKRIKRLVSLLLALTALCIFAACGGTKAPVSTVSPLQNRPESTPAPTTVPTPVPTAAPAVTDGNVDNSPNNSANSGLCLAVEDAGGNYYLYLSNKDSGGYGGTYCMTADGVYNVSDDYCQNMLEYDNAIYYTVGNKICVNNIMFGNKQELYDNGSWIYGMCQYGDTLLFVTSGCISEYDLTTGQVRDLAEAYYPYALTLSGNRLFYIIQGETDKVYYINYIDLDEGGEYTMFTSDDPVYFLTAWDGYLYLAGGDWIIQYDALTGEPIDYAEYKFHTTFLNAYDGYLYCNVQELDGVSRIPMNSLADCEFLASDAYIVPSVSAVGDTVFINYIAADETAEFCHFAILASGDQVNSGMLDDLLS